jgi:L-2-hydroxyglutarate oxidase LhgO
MGSVTTDFLIVGGGVIGVNLALQAKKRYPDAVVTLIEKEADCGEHASGRNSGVLHAGFYYTADSLKARLTRDGNRQLTEYCAERGLGINRCGKLVVAKNAT